MFLKKAKANPIDNLLSIVNAELPKLFENYANFSDWTVTSAYALSGNSSKIIFSGPWNATLSLGYILSEAGYQKQCILRRQIDWVAKISSIQNEIYNCASDGVKMGDEILNKMKKSYMQGFQISEDVKNVRKNCSTTNVKDDENCINQTIDRLKVSFKNLLQLVKIDKIEAQTITAKIISVAMYCNAKIMENVFKIAIDYQEMMRKCLDNK
ncbi:uncharacterized protein LOC127288943 [Leptopilina boulardi]|uniref:uncharacterized protein LOC127288943 n=1 Tax=Leptopilina boulardi TaxID=63433 RepID=UPI0021F6173A|nr:uncharacterized protein LOC127288943 [Leptopilina boulardi]